MRIITAVVLFVSIVGNAGPISDFRMHISPSANFILPNAALNFVDTTMPFIDDASCTHQGAHVHLFVPMGQADQTFAVYAPVDGSLLVQCGSAGGTPKLDVRVQNFADDNGAPVEFNMSVEPKTTAVSCADLDSQNHLGQPASAVTAGTQVASFIVKSGVSGAHIDFALVTNAGRFCPNIFNSGITSQFRTLVGSTSYTKVNCATTSEPYPPSTNFVAFCVTDDPNANDIVYH